MNRLATAVHMTLRGSGVLLILLGLAIWTGRADGIIPVHEVLGFVLVLSLWTLAFLAARAGVQRGLVVAGVSSWLFCPRIAPDPAKPSTPQAHRAQSTPPPASCALPSRSQ